jgi:predicted nucleotidyltransferase
MSTVYVPNINQRLRIPAQAIDDVVRQIVGKFKPQKIILFGSYARRQPRPESDVDLLVIMDTPLTETEQAVLILQNIQYHFGLDLLVRTPNNLMRRLELGDPFLHEIITEGKTLYERSND